MENWCKTAGNEECDLQHMCPDDCNDDYCALGHFCPKGLACRKKKCLYYHLCKDEECKSFKSCKKIHAVLKPKSMKKGKKTKRGKRDRK